MSQSSEKERLTGLFFILYTARNVCLTNVGHTSDLPRRWIITTVDCLVGFAVPSSV